MHRLTNRPSVVALALLSSIGLYAAVSAPPYRANCMDHIPGRQVPARRDHRLSCLASALFLPDLHTLFEDLSPTGPVDRAVHSGAAEQTAVGSIDYRISFLFGDIAQN